MGAGGFGGGFKTPKSMGVKTNSTRSSSGHGSRRNENKKFTKSPKPRRVGKEDEMELESPEDIFGGGDNEDNGGGLLSAIGGGGGVSIKILTTCVHIIW